MSREEMARALVQVTAGLIIGQMDDALTRTWTLTATEWEGRSVYALDEVLQQAHTWVMLLVPRRANWTRTEVVWL